MVFASGVGGLDSVPLSRPLRIFQDLKLCTFIHNYPHRGLWITQIVNRNRWNHAVFIPEVIHILASSYPQNLWISSKSLWISTRKLVDNFVGRAYKSISAEMCVDNYAHTQQTKTMKEGP